ncbi:MAG: HD domain-containing protein [Streptosporangiaceae bacterium]
MERLDRQLEFIAEAGRLRGVLRQTMLTDPARRENSAEHSWHLIVMAMALGEYAPAGTDLGTVTAMLALHDLVEIDAGDLFAYAADADQATQGAAEQAAADRIFTLLPPNQARTFRRLWDDFEDRRSPEARFARALDRLAPMLENVTARGGTWRQHGVSAERVMEKVALIEEGSPELGRFARAMIRRAVQDGILAPAAAVSGSGSSREPASMPSAGI